MKETGPGRRRGRSEVGGQGSSGHERPAPLGAGRVTLLPRQTVAPRGSPITVAHEPPPTTWPGAPSQLDLDRAPDFFEGTAQRVLLAAAIARPGAVAQDDRQPGKSSRSTATRRGCAAAASEASGHARQASRASGRRPLGFVRWSTARLELRGRASATKARHEPGPSRVGSRRCVPRAGPVLASAAGPLERASARGARGRERPSSPEEVVDDKVDQLDPDERSDDSAEAIDQEVAP